MGGVLLKIEGGYAGEGVKKTKCGGLRKKIEGGYAGESKEGEMQGGGGLRKKN